MFRKILILTLLIALLTACAPTQSTPVVDSAPTDAPANETPTEAVTEGLTFTDGLGREVTLAAPAQRVVSIAPSNTEILFAIGAGDQVVGRDELSDYPEEAKSVENIGSAFQNLNTELIISLKPDLVLAAEINTPEQVKQMEDAGLTVYYLNNPTTLEGLYENLELVAQLTGHEADAAALVESLKARVAAVDEKIAPLSSRISVFYQIDSTDPSKPYTAGKGTFITLLIERAGGYNIASELEGYPQISLEEIIAIDPAFIILGDSMWGVTPEQVAARPGWENLSAVKNGYIFPFDDNLVSRPGPRLVDGLEALAKLMRPGLFK